MYTSNHLCNLALKVKDAKKKETVAHILSIVMSHKYEVAWYQDVL
jgi:hypothetical protein